MGSGGTIPLVQAAVPIPTGARTVSLKFDVLALKHGPASRPEKSIRRKQIMTTASKELIRY